MAADAAQPEERCEEAATDDHVLLRELLVRVESLLDQEEEGEQRPNDQ